MQTIVSVFYYTRGLLAFLLAGVLIIPLLPFERFRYPAASLFSRLVLWSLGGRLVKEGDFPDDRRYIIMANHATFVDPLIIVAVIKGRFTGIIAESQTHYPLWSSLVKLFKVIPIKRRDAAAARLAITTAEERLAAGYHVVILPEGTRTLTGKMGPLKKGGFHMAINSGAPLLPLGIEGGFAFKSKLSWMLRPGTLRLRFVKPLEPEFYKDLSLEEVMDEMRQRLLSLSGEQVEQT